MLKTRYHRVRALHKCVDCEHKRKLDAAHYDHELLFGSWSLVISLNLDHRETPLPVATLPKAVAGTEVRLHV